jgi:hypothetical protein
MTIFSSSTTFNNKIFHQIHVRAKKVVHPVWEGVEGGPPSFFRENRLVDTSNFGRRALSIV